MAPVATVPHKANNHQRYLPEKTKIASHATHEFDLEASGSEAGALQPVSEPKEAAWEGFGGEEGEEAEDSNEEGGSDADSIDVVLEGKEQEKPILPKDAEEE